MSRATHETDGRDAAQFPHAGGCASCAQAMRCNACGADIRRDRSRCTNGRCGRCHAKHCAPGGATSPGHGYGSAGV